MIEIGTLCWFWDSNEDDRIVGIYGGKKLIDGYIRYHNINDFGDYNYCRPVKIEEIKLGDEECVNA